MGKNRRPTEEDEAFEDVLSSALREARDNGVQSAGIINPARYQKMMGSIETIKEIVTNALAESEYEDEECGAVFTFKEPDLFLGYNYSFIVNIPDYGVKFMYNELVDIVGKLPEGTYIGITPKTNCTIDISFNYPDILILPEE